MPLACRFAGLALCCAITLPVLASSAPQVTVTDDGPTYTLANGYLTVKVDKVTGDLVSLKTPKTATPNFGFLGFRPGPPRGFLEQSPALAARREAKISIDPANVGGERAE